ncbi:MAG: TonB-dependent receptor [Bacteroidales bacterium]|jgi:outer membrane receptor for ferrienterochelin and colicins|nr:TonB-dependent receptor [Bacteroidales bacterium]
MNKYIWVLVIALSIPWSVFSQKKTDANIVGDVKCKGEHLPFIAVTLKGTTIGTTTDATGHYFLKNLPEGDFTLVAYGLGYKQAEKQVSIVSGKTIEVNFEIEPDAIQLDGVVVSASRNEVNRKEAPVIVNMVSRKLFENTNSVCLAQGLNFQPGLRVETNCQNCGTQQVRINGLDGAYSQILIDSRPIFSALAGVYGIEQIPANMIDRVEVIRGGGSALFGANAIAGVINIITKEPTSNSVEVANTTNLIYGEKTDVNTTFNASVVTDNHRAGIMVFGTSRQRSPFDYDGDGFTEIGKIIAKNIGLRSYFRTSDYSKLTFEYHNLGEFRRGGNNLDLPPHEADIAEQTDHNNNLGNLKYDIFSKNGKHRLNIYSSAQHIVRKSYYGAQKDPNAYGKAADKTFAGGVQYSYSIDKLLFMPAELMLGTEYHMNHLKDEMLGYNRVIDQKTDSKSAFVQNEWKNQKLSLLFGFRFDKHNLIDNLIVSPRLNLRYSPNESVNFRTSYSSGFRAPQIFDEDLDVRSVGGEALLVINSPALETEKSQSYSVSADLYHSFGVVNTNLLIEGFYTNLDNVFVLEDIGTDSNGNTILERRNGSGAVVKGINFEGRVVPFEKIQVQFGLTLQKSEYKEAQKWSDNPNIEPQKTMFRAPNQYGYLTASYQVIKPMLISLSGTYTGKMLVQHFAGYIAEDMEKVTPEFYDVNLKLSYEFKLNESAKLQLNGGVQNIFNSYQNDFDKGEFRDAGYIYGPAMPRSFFFGLKFII